MTEEDRDDVIERSNERRRERTNRIEDMLNPDAEILDEEKYPATSEELSAEYGDQPIDLPNETESLGHVLDRMVDERFESPAELREAVYNAVTGEAAGPEEYNDERDLEELEDDNADDLTESGGTSP